MIRGSKGLAGVPLFELEFSQSLSYLGLVYFYYLTARLVQITYAATDELELSQQVTLDISFLIGLSLLTALFFRFLTLSSTSLHSQHLCDATQLLLPGPLSALVLPGSLVLGSSPCPLLFLVTSSFIPSLPTFRFLFEPSCHRFHFLCPQLSLGILSCAYLQDEDSQISLLLFSPCSCASNPSAFSTALMGCSGCLSPPLSSSPPVPFTVQQFSPAVLSSGMDTVSFSFALVDTLIFFLPHWKLTEHLMNKLVLISSDPRRGSRTRRLWELPGCSVSAFRLHQQENEQGSHSCSVSTSPWLCHGDWIFSPSLLSWQPEVKEHRCFTVWQLLQLFCFGLVVNEVVKDVVLII
ncbi:uncharacterized protein LOC117004617 [Catharus ustulatus]|uniref:uncharacterized protein LOC117004617 n=1 Tax=Catharus ustulatus TaxID=91951 RepID=UPI00140AAFB4|nr:uncharacterized protein LOC117004617 [Catharus ustulatus]